MLDLRFVLENLPQLQDALLQRGVKFDVTPINKLNEKRRALQKEHDDLRFRQNQVSSEIAKLKKANEDTSEFLASMKRVSERVKELNTLMMDAEKDMNDFLLQIPNIPHESVPIGSSPEQNKEIRKWGTPRSFSFQPKEHWEIGEGLGILDFERATKMSGARFTLYRGIGAALERALINFMVELQVGEHGYEEVLPPFMVHRESMTGTGQLPKFEEDLFQTTNGYFLIPTAEVPVTNIHREEVLDEEVLPISYVAYSPCFRSEAGSYGKDVCGLIRQHQFNKVEIVKFSRPEDSYNELEKLTNNAEEVLKRLELPYRVVSLCTGDLGFSAAKTYDIEAWFPAQGIYREISSCSNFGDFQARRAKIRFRRGPKGKPEYVHTLNGSALAVGRTVAAILENYQEKDGSVTVPNVLRPFLKVDKITRA